MSVQRKTRYAPGDLIEYQPQAAPQLLELPLIGPNYYFIFLWAARIAICSRKRLGRQ